MDNNNFLKKAMFNPILETENDNPPGPDGCRSHDVEIVVVGNHFFSSKYGRNEITLRFEETWQSVNNEAKFLIKLLFRNVQVYFTF